MNRIKELMEKWSKEYKSSIDCNNPKGFSQKAHCAGKKKKMQEEIPGTSVGGGNIAGLGVGPDGEPGVFAPPRKKKIKKKRLVQLMSMLKRLK
jgi:hypothetical protein